MVMDMSTRLIAGIAEADIERVRRPIPTSSTALAGSAAISPQRLTSIWACFSIPYCHPYKAQHRHIVGFVEICHLLVPSVHRERVLAQIIRPNRKEIAGPGEHVGADRRGWNLDHYAGLDVGVDAVAVGLAFPLRLGEESLRADKLIDGAYHGKHDFKLFRGSTRAESPRAGS